MGRQIALPPNLPPRLLPRDGAAAYVGLSPNKFDDLVELGLMPPPVWLGPRRKAFDVRLLDAAVDRLPDNRDAYKGAGRGSVIPANAPEEIG